VTNQATKTITALAVLAIIIYPFCVQAGVLGVFDWFKSGVGSSGDYQYKVLSSNTVAVAEEILSAPEQTIINMPLSQSINSPEPVENQTAVNQTMVDDSAFTNENSALDGSLDGDENTSDQISLYTVRSGDTVPLIAKMFGVTANTIYWANDLKSGSELKPDQVIIILPITGIKYTVKKGDNIDNLAKKFNADAGEIASFNNVDTSAGLTVGDELIIPNADPEIGSQKTNPKTVAKNKGSSKNTAGYFRRPINGGMRTQGIHGNNGIDLASFGGAHIPILAAADGTVLISKTGGWNGGYGNYVVIKHSNGTQTLYAHMSENTVRAGSRVSKGQQIGKMGNTGRSTGVHLHFEIRGGKNPF
jgi:murein DD-endopeptidase MepM/ murein hydrolase activator NlpD